MTHLLFAAIRRVTPRRWRCTDCGASNPPYAIQCGNCGGN